MTEPKRTAGLPLSVGSASPGVRLLLATIFLAAAALCIAAGVLLSSDAAARVVAVVLIVPIGLIGLVGVAFTLAPWSRFGVWLDHFVPRLREPRVALVTTLTLWAIALAITSV